MLVDFRWSSGDIAHLRKDAAELVTLGSDCSWPVSARPRGAATGEPTMPIVFAHCLDPVDDGFVASLVGRAAT